jgi:hypothetical protein
LFINQADSEQLNKIRQAVTAQASIEKIIELCQTIADKITDKQFALTYAGILVASQDRISDAIWQEIAEQGRWNIVETTPIVSLPDRICTFAMELTSKVLA